MTSRLRISLSLALFLCAQKLCAQLAPAEDFFNGGAQLYISNNVPAALLVSTIFCRSAWRYRQRGYRCAIIDTGHLVQNLVGVAPLRYETAAAVAGTLADQVEEHLPDDYQAQQYARLAQTSTAEATAAVVTAFPENRLVTILVGDAAQIESSVAALGIGSVTVVTD